MPQCSFTSTDTTKVITFLNVAAYPPELSNTVNHVNGPRLFLQYAFVDEACT